jgi:hypothetical protein
VKSIRAGEVREHYANNSRFAVIDQLEAIGKAHGWD